MNKEINGKPCRPHRELPPDSPTSWTLPRSGSVSISTSEEVVMTVGDTEVKMRKSKKKKKRSSMIFITEERERTNTLDCKRVRGGDMRAGGSEEAAHRAESLVWSLSPSSCPRSRSSAATPTWPSPTRRAWRSPAPTPGRCRPSQVCSTHSHRLRKCAVLELDVDTIDTHKVMTKANWQEVESLT